MSNQPSTAATTTSSKRDALRQLPLSAIRVADGFNPRAEVVRDGAFDALVATIRDRGLLQPIRVREEQPGAYVVIAGHRRYFACIDAALMVLPAIVAEEADESEQLVDALIENDLRADLNPLERARGYARLKAGGLTVKGIAERLQTKQARVKEHLAVLELPDRVQRAVSDKTVPLHAIKALSALAKLHAELPVLAADRVLASLERPDELYEPLTWSDLTADPIGVCCTRNAELGGELPDSVWDIDEPIELDTLSLSDAARGQLAELAELTGRPQRFWRLDRSTLDQATALGALHAARSFGGLLIGADVAAQLASDAIAATLTSAQQAARERAARQAETPSPSGAASEAADSASAEQADVARREQAQRERDEQQAARAAAEAFNDRLGAALLNALARVKVDARVMRLLLAASTGAELQQLAMRGARYGLPGWVTETQTSTGKTKRSYLDASSSAAKARELLDGATTPGDHAGRALVLLAMAVFADEHAVAMSSRTHYAPRPAGPSWAAAWHADLDALLSEQLPAGLLDEHLARRAEAREEAAIRAADQAAARQRIAHALTHAAELGEDELTHALAELDHAYTAYSVEKMQATRVLRDALDERRAAASPDSGEDAAS